MPLLLDTVVRASRWQGLHGRVALHADHRGTSQHQDDLVSSVGLTQQNYLKGNVLEVIERRHLLRQPMRWSDVPRFAETAAVVEATSAQMDGLPPDADFGSFDELKARRDATNVVRLR